MESVVAAGQYRDVDRHDRLWLCDLLPDEDRGFADRDRPPTHLNAPCPAPRAPNRDADRAEAERDGEKAAKWSAGPLHKNSLRPDGRRASGYTVPHGTEDRTHPVPAGRAATAPYPLLLRCGHPAVDGLSPLDRLAGAREPADVGVRPPPGRLHCSPRHSEPVPATPRSSGNRPARASRCPAQTVKHPPPRPRLSCQPVRRSCPGPGRASITMYEAFVGRQGEGAPDKGGAAMVQRSDSFTPPE